MLVPSGVLLLSAPTAVSVAPLPSWLPELEPQRSLSSDFQLAIKSCGFGVLQCPLSRELIMYVLSVCHRPPARLACPACPVQPVVHTAARALSPSAPSNPQPPLSLQRAQQLWEQPWPTRPSGTVLGYFSGSARDVPTLDQLAQPFQVHLLLGSSRHDFQRKASGWGKSCLPYPGA